MSQFSLFLVSSLTILSLLSSCSGCASYTSGNSSTDRKSHENIDANAGALDINSIIRGEVVAILDGDTYDILLDGNHKERIRMEGIDAPEKGMPFYRVAKKYLSDLCFNQVVRIERTGKDGRDRTIAYTYLDDGRELSHEMIKAGLAWHFKKYSADTELANLEIIARDSKIGLWVDNDPMPPWENRRLHRAGISTKDSFNLKY